MLAGKKRALASWFQHTIASILAVPRELSGWLAVFSLAGEILEVWFHVIPLPSSIICKVETTQRGSFSYLC